MLRPIGIYAEPKLLIGQGELSFLAFLPQEFQRVALRARMIEAGLCVQPVACGNAGLAWRVEQFVAGDPLIVRFDRGMPNGATPALFACMANGDICAVEPQGNDAHLSLDGVTVPDDGVWRTLTIHYTTTHLEPGTATFTGGSKTVTGTNTRFTRLAGKTGDNVRIGDKIYVKTGVNAGTYWEIDEVVSDTELTLINNATGTQTSTFLVSGSYYLDDIPTDPTARTNPSWVIELQDNVVVPDPENYLVIADVMLDTGVAPKVQVIDRRLANMFRLQPDPRAAMRTAVLAISMSIASCNSTTISEPTYYQQMVAETRRAFSDPGSTYSVSWTTMAPASNGVDILAVSSAFNEYLRVSKYTAKDTLWSARVAGGVQPDSSGDIYASHLQLLPPQIGSTHTLVYQIHASQTIYQRRTPDDGATWSSQTSVINDPDIVDAPTPVILTRSGRMWVFYAFNDGSTFYGIRAVYSDDYGGSWETNGGSGYEVIQRAYDGVAFIAPQDVTETDDGRIAVLCADRPDSGTTDVVMCVLFTESTLDVAWDPGEDVAGASVFGPDTVRLENTAGEPVYSLTQTYQASAIQALPGGALAIISYIYGANDRKSYASVVSIGGAQVDPDLADRRTLQIVGHTELNWIANSLHATTVPDQVSARIMPGGDLYALVKRSYSHEVYDSIKIKVCDAPRALTFQPACWADLNP
jgi:hypothetical protein